MMASAYQEFLTNRKLPSELFKTPGKTPPTFLQEFESHPFHTMGKLSPTPQQCADSFRDSPASQKYDPLASQNRSASQKYDLSTSQKYGLSVSPQCDLSASQKYGLSTSQKCDLSTSHKYDLSASPQCDQSASQKYDSMTLCCPRDSGTLKDFTASKPDLKFSIERILGLTPSQGTYEGLHFLGDVADEQEGNFDEEDSVDVEETSRVDDFNSDNGDEDLKKPHDEDDEMKYQWLQCTRYHPPKLPRNKKKDGPKKRKLGRNPRVPFTQHQVLVLEEKFRRTHYLSSMDVAELSSALNLTETRVKIWFQNRRARERRDKGGDQYQQAPLAQKPFQPLTIPSVSWSISPSNYMHYPQVLDFRPGYMAQAFNVYNTRGTRELPTNISNDKLTSQ